MDVQGTARHRSGKAEADPVIVRYTGSRMLTQGGLAVMEEPGKRRRTLSITESTGDIPDWVNSLLPVGVAFACYVSIILAAGIEPKAQLIAYGAAAAFIGLECYWILRGLRNNHLGTMVTGILGAALAVYILDLFLSLA